jgi:hypothetical protein
MAPALYWMVDASVTLGELRFSISRTPADGPLLERAKKNFCVVSGNPTDRLS